MTLRGGSHGAAERRHPRESAFPWLSLALCVPVLLPVILLCAHVAWQCGTALHTHGLAHLLVWKWNPDAHQYGLLPLVAGTLAGSALAMAIWLPLGLGTACWLGVFAPARARRCVETAIGILASVPTAVAGLCVLICLVPFTGFSLASAAAVLALLNLPLFTAGAAAAIRQRSGELRQPAEALGLPSGAVCRLIVAKAWRGVLIAALAAFARSSGEALGVSMVAGNLPLDSWALTAHVQTLGATLAVDRGAGGEHAAMLSLVQCALIALVLTLSLIVRKIESRP